MGHAAQRNEKQEYILDGKCIKQGDLVGFDTAMSAGADEFVKRRIYLPLEKGRELTLRNLFRKVFLAGGYEAPKSGQPPIRRTRVPVAEFVAALRIGTRARDKSRADFDEVECLLSSLIYKVCSDHMFYRYHVLISANIDPYERLHRPRSGYSCIEQG